MNFIWNPEYETMEREKLRALQFERLQMSLRWAYNNVPLYRQRWMQVGLKPQDIKSLSDIVKVPFTTKADYRQHSPYGLFAVPLEQVVRIQSSSGTTSAPTVVGFTR
jgi:phenylacetate-CoA ligase